MNDFEKAERLREIADVTFEQARDALRACNGDILDAMVYLEKLGYGRRPGYTIRNNAEKAYYKDVAGVVAPEVRDEPKQEGRSFLGALGHLIGTAVKKSLENYVVVSHEGEVKFRISVFAFVLLFMIFSFSMLIAMVVSLFFGVKYSFAGKADLSKVNDVMNRAGDKAAQWWSNCNLSPEIAELCNKYDHDRE